MGRNSVFLIDTGASLSILSRRLVDEFSWHDCLEDAATTVTLADGRSFSLNQSMDTALLLADTLVTCRFIIADIPVDAILGIDILQKLPCSISLGNKRIFSVLPDCISDFGDVFNKELSVSKLEGVICGEVIPTPSEKPVRSAVTLYGR